MLLAGDVGGTKTLLGFFDSHTPRPLPIAVHEFSTLDFSGLAPLVSAFATQWEVPMASVRSACFGVAGPVIGEAASLTNVPWRIDGPGIAGTLGIPRVALLNDLQAMAYGVTVLRGDELLVLQEGTPVRGGNMALLAAGTGLGEALLHNVEGQFIPSPSEAGHSDFPARSEREIVVLRHLIRRFGRACVEDVVSGPGLVNLHEVTHDASCPALPRRDHPDAPAIISTAALERSCLSCVEALELFVDAYGAEAGNLALRTVATAGVFVGGGIARKIMPALTDGRFLRAFTDKAPFEDMLRKMPVKVILNGQVALLGAAVYAGWSR